MDEQTIGRTFDPNDYYIEPITKSLMDRLEYIDSLFRDKLYDGVWDKMNESNKEDWMKLLEE